MPQFRFSIRVPLSRERAFTLYTDADRLTEWFPQARAVAHLTAPLDHPGSTYTIRFDGLPDAREEVLEIVPGVLQRRHFVQGRGVSVWGEARIHFRTVDGETEVEEEVEYGYSPALLSPLLMALFDRTSRAAMRRELESFRRLAEAEARGVTSRNKVYNQPVRS
jgi:uncharacterized protein YndB with AHSA1/START domain